MEPWVVVTLGGLVTGIIFVIGIPLTKAYTRKIDSDAKDPRIPPAVESRLDRIERAVEAVAIEVERISEGQRFTTKLLSEGKSATDPRQSVPTGTTERDRIA